MGRTPDLSDQEFGRLRVLSFAGRDRAGRARWLCQCECAKEVEINAYRLQTGHTRSCGCLRIEASVEKLHGVHTRQTAHGLSKTKEYKSWSSMMHRCSNALAHNYSNYGGRGIVVCERWFQFENFLADMGERPIRTSLDRIDNDGAYEPGNCQWSTPVTQSGNRRNSRYIIVEDKRMTVAEAARQYGIDRGVVRVRLGMGWSVKKALSTPVRACIRRAN
jgi:hypothetical protein